MKAVFKVKTIKNNWKPPFKKEIEEKEFIVSKNEAFDEFIDGRNGKIMTFKLLELGHEKALVKYALQFSLAGGVNPGNKEIWVEKNNSVSFTYLWGNQGITKEIILKEIQS